MFPENMSTSIIIDNKTRIQSTRERIFYVPLPEGSEAENYSVIGYKSYKLQCGREIYEIACPEVQTPSGKTLIVPAFMKPGRPYPIYVYIYAIMVYAANPDMGQREAAKQTRTYFGLETFSHTTLGRAMKRIEQQIIAEPKEEEWKGQEGEAGRFPTVEEMRRRKSEILSYLKEAAGNEDLQIPAPKPAQPRPPYKGAFIDACHLISAYTNKKYCRMLL